MNTGAKVYCPEQPVTDEKQDRRVRRTRELLKTTLMRLIDEKGYDAVTIQDITERANLGRTTFYRHYQSKEDLLLDHHADFAAHWTLRPLRHDELMSDTPPDDFERFLQALADDKAVYLAIKRAKEAEFIMRGVRQQMANNLEQSLRSGFADAGVKYPLDLLANYLVGAQLSLIDWWLTHRTTHDAKDVARTLHRLQRAVLQNAFGLPL
jgi:AcrR family transcriptional regulator